MYWEQLLREGLLPAWCCSAWHCRRLPRYVTKCASTITGRVDPKLTHCLGGLQIEGEDDAYDFGSGAGFYVDATKEPWSKGYNMYSYITKELPEALFSSFKELDSSKVSITGHSMGGHGALTLVRLLAGGASVGTNCGC